MKEVSNNFTAAVKLKGQRPPQKILPKSLPPSKGTVNIWKRGPALQGLTD